VHSNVFVKPENMEIGTFQPYGKAYFVLKEVSVIYTPKQECISLELIHICYTLSILSYAGYNSS